jgi:hypothetical protein
MEGGVRGVKCAAVSRDSIELLKLIKSYGYRFWIGPLYHDQDPWILILERWT